MTKDEKSDALYRWSRFGAYLDADGFIYNGDSTILIDGHVTVDELEQLIDILKQ
jgi:hypothetical protein